MKMKFFIGERNYSNGEFTTNVIRKCASWDEATKACEEMAEEWAAEGLDARLTINDYDMPVGVTAYDPKTYDTVHEYIICYEYVPEKDAIDKTIPGYELVKDVVYAIGEERTGGDLLFVVRDGSDYLHGLCGVYKNEGNKWSELEARYTLEDGYHVWCGTIIWFPEGSATLPEGGCIISFYWS